MRTGDDNSGDVSLGDQLFTPSTGVLHRLPLLVLHVLDLLLIELIFLFFIAISDALRFTIGIVFCFVPSGYGHCKETLTGLQNFVTIVGIKNTQSSS